MEQESIYNLIPTEYIPPSKESRYVSRYPPLLPPTSSTFINHTTSRPKVNCPIAAPRFKYSNFKGR